MKDIHAQIERGPAVAVGGHQVSLPILYRRLETFFAVYGADAKIVKSLLPSPRLRPVPVWPGRVALSLNAFNYLDTDIGPYGEFSVGVPCVISHLGSTLVGVYIHRLPVTSDVAMQAGKLLWGYPKFVCQMDFSNSSAQHRVRLHQDNTLILDLRVERSGLALGLGRTLNTFTALDGNIIRTELVFQGVARTSPQGLAQIETGTHNMGLELAGLNLRQRPIITGEFLDLKLVLPQGQILGPV